MPPHRRTAQRAVVGANTRLTDSDLDAYLRVGGRQHTRNTKIEQLRGGENPILSTPEKVVEFIKSALGGNARNKIKAYGKVGSRFANDVASETNGELNISDYYLELDGNRLEHLSDHIEEDEDVRNIPFTEEQALLIPEYIDNYDDVLKVVKRKDGSKRIYLGKKINGHSVIIVLASKERNSVQPVTAWQNTTEHYTKVYGNKKARVDAPRTQAKNAQEESGYKPASSNHTVTPSEQKVNRDVFVEDVRNRAQNPSVGAADAGFAFCHAAGSVHSLRSSSSYSTGRKWMNQLEAV